MTSAARSVHVERLSAHHDVSRFTCQEPALASFLHDRAFKLQQEHACAVYVVLEPCGNLLGYFTLSTHALYREALSRSQSRKYPFNPISAVLLGQFARDTKHSPKGFGSTLLREALTQAATIPGWQLFCADPFSEESDNWFRKAGFHQVQQHFPQLPSSAPVKRLKLYLTRAEVEKTLDALRSPLQ